MTKVVGYVNISCFLPSNSSPTESDWWRADLETEGSSSAAFSEYVCSDKTQFVVMPDHFHITNTKLGLSDLWCSLMA